MSLYWKELHQKGILTIPDLKNKHNNFLRFHALRNKYNIETTFLRYYSLINAIGNPNWHRKTTIFTTGTVLTTYSDNYTDITNAKSRIYTDEL